MNRAEYPAAMRSLIAELKRLPGIGSRSAERIALWMIQSKDSHPDALSEAIHRAANAISPCTQCGFFAEKELCEICVDPRRDTSLLCVVESPTDILSLERSASFNGLYHALGGRLSPLNGIGPESLRIDALLTRTLAVPPAETILALSADVEGEATANYLADLLRSRSGRISRIAQGLPAGTSLEFADDLTLHRALTGRRYLG
jgi:recombination protein RecR